MKLCFFDDFKLGVLNGDQVVDVSDAVKDIPRVGPQDVINGVITGWATYKGKLEAAAKAGRGVPLMIAGVAFLIGALASWRGSLAGAVIMMVLFLHAARLALVAFDPYLASRPLAEALNRAPRGKLILDDQYYTFSSVVFYAEAYHGQPALLLNGRVNNLEYGSYATGAPDVFIDDARFVSLWNEPARYYLLTYGTDLPRLEELVGRASLRVVKKNADNYLLTNHPLP